MCCYTHQDATVPGALAEREETRCQCKCGGLSNRCPRRATQEDFRCDTCREERDNPGPGPALRRIGQAPYDIVIQPSRWWTWRATDYPP
jgi:hypothetical protein